MFIYVYRIFIIVDIIFRPVNGYNHQVTNLNLLMKMT